jgi:CelD/BcsL family acetyltransferase involved in cellulose biosynthesis
MRWIVTPISELAASAEQWQTLNRATGDSPLLDFRFVREAVAQFATGSERLAICYKQDAPIAMAVLTRANRFCWQTLQPPNAPIGLWLCKTSGDVEELLHGLAVALTPQCGMVSITQQDPDFVPRPNKSPHLSTLGYIVTASISAPSSFELYMQSRSKNFRHNVSRQRNRLKRENITTRLEIVTAPGDMARAVSDYGELEVASWKGRINSAVRIDEPQGRFYVALMMSFAEVGEALVYRYFFGDQLVASDLCLRRDGTLIILKTACVETLQGFSPAHLMRLDAFAELFDRHGVHRVEFYGPLKEWHTRLTEDTREMYHVNYYRWPLLRVLHELRANRRKNAALTAEAARSAPEPSAQTAAE